MLELNEDAPLAARYLKARAKGLPRPQIMRELSIPWSYSSLIAVEWNALTYAGHTVWNRHTRTQIDKAMSLALQLDNPARPCAR